jgi:hypothetical protein
MVAAARMSGMSTSPASAGVAASTSDSAASKSAVVVDVNTMFSSSFHFN